MTWIFSFYETVPERTEVYRRFGLFKRTRTIPAQHVRRSVTIEGGDPVHVLNRPEFAQVLRGLFPTAHMVQLECNALDITPFAQTVPPPPPPPVPVPVQPWHSRPRRDGLRGVMDAMQAEIDELRAGMK